MISSLDTVIYTAYFLVPGYIISEIVRCFMPAKNTNDFEKSVRCLGYSIVELAIWFWLFDLINNSFESHNWAYWLILVLSVIITSIVLGFVIGILRQKVPFKTFADKLKIKVEHPIPTAWDYKFFNCQENKWVCVNLDDDTCIRGLYGAKSFSSSDSEQRDLYLEEAYTKEEGEHWEKVESTDGVWISSKNIKWISFFDNNILEENYGEQGTKK